MFSTTFTVTFRICPRRPSRHLLSRPTFARSLSSLTYVRPLLQKSQLTRFAPSFTGPNVRSFSRCLPRLSSQTTPPQNNNKDENKKLKITLATTIRENIYTLPNVLTVSRILACPILGWSIVHDNFTLATSLLVYAGLTDLVDGFLARRYKMHSVLGTILDPAADKTLMTTLTVTLAIKSLIPLPLAVIILGRDVLLSLSAFWIRYTSLPPPKTFQRYWDFSIPSAEVRPTTISKINTALQLLLMGTTTISPILPYDISIGLQALQWIVGTTTIWSGLSYIFSKDAVRIISSKKPPSPPSTPPPSAS